MCSEVVYCVSQARLVGLPPFCVALVVRCSIVFRRPCLVELFSFCSAVVVRLSTVFRDFASLSYPLLVFQW